MRRLIDGDALCRVLNDHWLATSPSDRDTEEVAAERAAMCKGLDYAMRIVEQMPTIGGWISVKDRLPEESGRYLCWFGKNKALKGAEIVMYVDEWKAFGSLQSLETYPNVTHWMPIEPPKEVSMDGSDA